MHALGAGTVVVPDIAVTGGRLWKAWKFRRKASLFQRTCLSDTTSLYGCCVPRIVSILSVFSGYFQFSSELSGNTLYFTGFTHIFVAKYPLMEYDELDGFMPAFLQVRPGQERSGRGFPAACRSSLNMLRVLFSEIPAFFQEPFSPMVGTGTPIHPDVPPVSGLTGAGSGQTIYIMKVFFTERS